MDRTRVLLALLLAATLPAGCADRPAADRNACSHFDTALHHYEDVPECLFRSRDVLINGLYPINPDQQP